MKITISRNPLAHAIRAMTLAVAAFVVSSFPSIGYGQEAATITAGNVTFVNGCTHPISFVSAGSPVGRMIGTLPVSGRKMIPLSAFNQGGANAILVYPNLPTAQCPNCDQWTALGGVPGTKQREGWMWDAPNATFARYCNPNLSGRAICAAQQNCCGASMVQDGTFGTLFELTPRAGANDYVDLSTNYGFVTPHDPPKLCGPGVNPNDCVSKAANIFSVYSRRVDHKPRLLLHHAGHQGERSEVPRLQSPGGLPASHRRQAGVMPRKRRPWLRGQVLSSLVL